MGFLAGALVSIGSWIVGKLSDKAFWIAVFVVLMNFLITLSKSWLGWLLVWVVGSKLPILRDVLGMIKVVLIWILTEWIALFGSLLDYLHTLMPSFSQPVIGDLQTWVNAVNHWVPLDVALSLCSLVFTFRMFLTGFRMAMRFVPGIGGA